ncbi:class I lanthipeptide [Corallibacter sp.]|uniref:class I lanthipeptide n=1 Tax=Corallibacter sp. TaxID=2038084 RepID=UPI003A8DC3F4
MKTNKSKLNFKKSAITELNDQEVFSIQGGGTTTIIGGDDPTGYVCSNCISHTLKFEIN